MRRELMCVGMERQMAVVAGNPFLVDYTSCTASQRQRYSGNISLYAKIQRSCAVRATRLYIVHRASSFTR